MQFVPGPFAEMGAPFGLINVTGWAWLIVAAIMVFGGSLVLRWLWNLTLPNLTQWPHLSYWQAFRLVLLASLLGLIIRVF
jgi:hypothetical protein